MRENKEPENKTESDKNQNGLDDLDIKSIKQTTSRKQAIRNLMLLIVIYASSMGLLYWLLR